MMGTLRLVVAQLSVLLVLLMPSQTWSDKLFGWTGIEDHLARNDSVMVKDWVDDLDTMLVFVRM